MEDLNINILKGFKIKAKSVKKEKLSYIVNTDSGVKIIRKTPADAKSIIFQNEIKTHLYDNGFKNTDIYYMSVQGKPFFEFNNENYIMIDYIDGRSPDFSLNGDFKQTLAAVGRMHSVSKKFKIKDELKLFQKNNLPEIYSKKLNELFALKKRIKKQNKLSDFDVMFLKNHDFYLENLKASLELLEKLKYNIISEEAKQKNELNHNSIKEEFLFLSRKQNDVYITNFNESLIDTSIIDLADIIKRYIKNSAQNRMSVSEILEIYTSENELSTNEINAVFPLIMYPDKFIKVCSQYYSKRRTWVPSAINARMNMLIEKKDIEKEFIDEFCKTINI